MMNEIAAAQAARRPMMIQIRMRREDGEWIWVEFNGQFDFDPQGRPRRLLGVVSDVTERRKMEERLRERAKLESVGLLAGGVAHDFNNLLTGILGNATLALDLLTEGHLARRMIEGVVTASERAASLTQQMLAYSGRGRFVIAPVDISKLVREMSGLLRTSIDRSIELRLGLDPSLPSVEADPVQMQQLVMNLIINAAEAMQDRQGAVTIRTFLCDLDQAAVARLNPAFDVVPGQYVCLEVADEGCGMDETTMAKIFDPFFTTKFTGRGLGLSAVLGIVRGHKGSLEVASEVGKGTTFRIHLPAIVPLDQLASLWRGIVLVVDDEEIVRKTASSIIELTGFRVITAENGAEALRQFQAHKGRIDVTILDLSMPVMGGEAALERIRQEWPGARVVISTGFAAEDATQRFSAKGVAGFLQKPYTISRVTELFRELGLAQAN
jgi:signal transduction histidine kinase/CheY-like chemotaxis protein